MLTCGIFERAKCRTVGRWLTLSFCLSREPGATSIRLYSQDFGMEFHFFNFLGYMHPVHRRAPGGNIDTVDLLEEVKLGMQRYEKFNPNLFPEAA